MISMHRQYVLVDYHSVDNARLPVGVLARKGNESRHNFIHFFFLVFLEDVSGFEYANAWIRAETTDI